MRKKESGRHYQAKSKMENGKTLLTDAISFRYKQIYPINYNTVIIPKIIIKMILPRSSLYHYQSLLIFDVVHVKNQL